MENVHRTWVNQAHKRFMCSSGPLLPDARDDILIIFLKIKIYPIKTHIFQSLNRNTGSNWDKNGSFC